MPDDQGPTTGRRTETCRPGTSWARYRPAMELSLAIQAALLLSTSLILDGGRLFRICLIASAAQWACTMLIVLRRPQSPTKPDLLVVGFGVLALMAAAVLIAPLLGRTW
jgi:hypothetical protein